MGNFGARTGLPSDGANAFEPRKRTPGSIIQSDGTISWDVTVVRAVDTLPPAVSPDAQPQCSKRWAWRVNSGTDNP